MLRNFQFHQRNFQILCDYTFHTSRFFFFFLFFSFFGLIAWEILVPEAGTEPMLPSLGAQSLNHRTTREVPHPEFSIKSMLSFSNKLGNRRQYLSVNNVTVCFFHLQLLWNFTTRNKKQHIGSVCYFQIVCFVFTAQNSLLILITTNH